MKIRANLSLDPAVYEDMKQAADERNTSVSGLLTQLFLIYRDTKKEVEEEADR